jgi:tetratricopeptide (TPR) repeat protein
LNADTACARARAAIQLGRHEEGVREAGLAVAADPEGADGYYLLGLALRALGRHDEALRAVDSGTTKAPQWHDLFVLRSDILRDKLRPMDAMKAAEEAVRLEANDPDCHTAVGLSASALGDHPRAVVAYRRALKLDPDRADLHRLLGDQHLDLSDHAQAIVEYHHALRLEPNDAYALNNLGCALQAQGRLEEAAVAYKSAVLLDPTMKEAKRNTHNVVRGLTRGASVLGVIGLFAVKFKLWVLLIFARGLLVMPAFWIVIGAVIAGAVAFSVVRGRRRLSRLGEKDPQLLAIFERLQADKKAGRI